MKNKDLPSAELINKLMATSFKSPTLNKQVFLWCNQIIPQIEFVESERIKLIKLYGEDIDGNIIVPKDKEQEFINEFNQVLNADVGVDIIKFSLTEQDFEDDVCRYAKNEQYWLSAKDINTLMKFTK